MIRIYGKKKTAKRYAAFDHARGVFVGNLIYATVWTDAERDDVQTFVNHMNKYNSTYTFKIRVVKEKE